MELEKLEYDIFYIFFTYLTAKYYFGVQKVKWSSLPVVPVSRACSSLAYIYILLFKVQQYYLISKEIDY